MICPNCTTETLDDARFCTHCGASLFDALGDEADNLGPRTEAVPAVDNPPAPVAPAAPGSWEDDGQPVVRRRSRRAEPLSDARGANGAGTEAVPVVTDAPISNPPGASPAPPLAASSAAPPSPPPQEPAVAPPSGAPAGQDPATQVHPYAVQANDASGVDPAAQPAGPSAWDQPDGAATAVNDLSAPEPPRAAPRPLPAPAPSSTWTTPDAQRTPRHRQQRQHQPRERARTGRWARVIAGLLSLWLPISALIYVVLDQGELVTRTALELAAIITPTRLSWGVWSSTGPSLPWTVTLRVLALLAAFGALVILAAWMARSRPATRVGLVATGLAVVAFGVVQLLWLTVGLDLRDGLTLGQEVRQIYVPAGVSITAGLLLIGLAPAASRSRS